MKYFPLFLLLFFTLAACGSSSVNTAVPSPTTAPTRTPLGVHPAGSQAANATPTPTTSTLTKEPHWGKQTKTTGCKAHGGLPDAACTPGDIIPTATKAIICQAGYASSVRNVPTSEKNQAYAEYGIASHMTGQYEVDHLVSLELGGSNAISNLWPELASPKPGFHEKDKIENYLHRQVCTGAISLKQAQIEIATNWLGVHIA